MFKLYEPIIHKTKGKGRIIGFTGSHTHPVTVEYDSGGTDLIGYEDIVSAGNPPAKKELKQRPEALIEGPVEFKQGETVPVWIYEAEIPELQKEATFACDVIVDWVGHVRVTQKEELSAPMYELINITEKGSKTSWTGYPTELKPLLKEELNDSRGN